MKDIVIRQPTLNDLQSIQNINYELFKLEKDNFDSTLIVDWPLSEEGKQYFEKIINNEYVIIATENEKGSYELIQYGEINNTLVDNNYIGSGIGKQLINCFKEYCKTKNITNLKLVASVKNANAIELYRKRGFNDFALTLTMKMERDY